jgi:hypothetical protein
VQSDGRRGPGIEDVGVEDGAEGHGGVRLAARGLRLAVAALDLLGELGQLAQLLAPAGGAELAVGEHVLDVQASVRADPVVGDLAAVEQPYVIVSP